MLILGSGIASQIVITFGARQKCVVSRVETSEYMRDRRARVSIASAQSRLPPGGGIGSFPWRLCSWRSVRSPPTGQAPSWPRSGLGRNRRWTERFNGRWSPFSSTWAGTAFAQAPGAAAPPPAQKAAKEIPLYPGVAPGSEKWDWSERSVTSPTGLPMVQDVVRPVLLHYPAERGKAVGTAMIVAPGGGFRVLMMSYEGVDIARRLNAMGIDAFVLKYRLIHSGPGPRAARPGRT